MLAQVRSLLRPPLRRGSPRGGSEVLRFRQLTLALATREVRHARRAIELTPTEFSLLELFLRNPRRVLTRSFIFTQVWGFDFGERSNALNVCVGNLRRKTEAGGEPRLIHTVRGVGYVLRHRP
jgi:two-component system response regulator MprA